MHTPEVNTAKGQSAARLVSNLVHPYVVLVPVLALAAFLEVREPFEIFKWTALSYVSALLFPTLHIKILGVIVSRRGEPEKVSREFVRDRPLQLFVMAVLFGMPPALILYFLGGPRDMLIIILGITLVMVVLSLVNLAHRASFHLAMITAMLSALLFMVGPLSLTTLPLLPVLGLSRYRLGMHTPPQLVSGFFIGLAVSAGVFIGFGLGA
jgi:membrane-associated phospholipid phosphatase